MVSNKFSVAGWLAVVQALLFPLIYVVAFAEKGITNIVMHVDRPFYGPSDLMTMAYTVISVYALLMFKKLLNERFEYHDLDLLIYISIWWVIVFEITGLGLRFFAIALWDTNRILIGVVYLVFLTASMVTIGIVDILIAVKLLRIKEVFSEYIRAFAYISMATGICEVSVLLTPIALLLAPFTWIILALIFFRNTQDVQYV